MKKRISLAKNAAVKKPAPVPMETSRRLWGFLGKLPSGLAEILLLFLVSRGVLTMVGVLSVSLIARRKGGRLEWDHPSQSWLDIWGQWDTGWYLDIAKNWYAAEAQYQNYSNYAFFPFYPTLIKLLGAVLGDH
jgi:hypothetical protein